MTGLRKSDVDLLSKLAIAEARVHFGAYRRYIHPKLIDGWFVRSMETDLQKFYDDWRSGLKPVFAIEAPPQHGKSSIVVDFITWVCGKHPEIKTIYTSFSERLGIRANLLCQRIFTSKAYNKVFPKFEIAKKGNSNEFGATRNRELIEFIGNEGSFRNTTVRGSITGESLDLGVIDDPIKGREAANSETIRNGVWDWLTDDFFTRFSENAALLFIMTRWHVDDPLSRIQAEMGDAVKVRKFKAIAEEDEEYRKEGEALFPKLKSKEFLLARKKIMAKSSWVSLYQQSPTVAGGSLIHSHWFGRYKILPKIKERRMYCDTAQKTKERNDFTAFEIWGLGEDGKIYLIDLIRQKWEAPELRRRAIDFWNKHLAFNKESLIYGRLTKMKVEDKASGTGLIQEIKTNSNPRIPVVGIERNIDKYTRFLDIAGYIESGYVMIPEEAPWINDFLLECEQFSSDDSHPFDDQIDPMMDAINDFLVGGSVIEMWKKLGAK